MDIQGQINNIQARLQNAMDEMVDKIDRTKLRPLQRNAHLKIADCYGMKNASADEVQRCVQVNSQMMQQIDQIVNGEIQNFQNRLQRCANTCQDDFQSDNYNNRSGVPTEASQKKMVSCF
eukprot:gene18172-13047_t